MLHEAQTDPATFDLVVARLPATVERLEDMREVGSRYPRAMIFDLDRRAVPTFGGFRGGSGLNASAFCGTRNQTIADLPAI